MTITFDEGAARKIIDGVGAVPEMLVQILNGFVDEFSWISEEAVRFIAGELNLSRADVHGVVSFYHDHRTTPAGKRMIRICQAESCQAMGGDALTAHAERSLGIELHTTSDDGEFSLEPVYCLGNCACSPAIMIGDRVYGRVDAQRFDDLMAATRG
ncbi:MAG: NAD(P)H-dependent oxidoreductase subunit E [Woeseia sp.]